MPPSPCSGTRRRAATAVALAAFLSWTGCGPVAPSPPTSRPAPTTEPAAPAPADRRPEPSASAVQPARAPSPSPSPSPRPLAPSTYELAFVREGSIWLADLNGRALRLTQGGRDAEPRWSPDGTRLVFVRGLGATADLYTIAADGSDLRRVTVDRLEQASPRWSPRGDAIAYVQPRDADGDGRADPVEDAEVWLGRTDGSGGRKLAEGFDPAWSADGARLAYATNGKRRADPPAGARDNALRLLDLASGADRELLPLGAVPQQLESSNNFPFRPGTFRVRAPDWSPDGRRLAASADGHAGLVLTFDERSSDPRVWQVNYEGSVGRALHSPRGGLLALESRPASGYGHVIVVDTATGHKVDIGSERLDVSAAEPTWAPDGQRLAAVIGSGVLGAEAASRELVVFDRQGSPLRRVAAGAISEPAWNPVR